MAASEIWGLACEADYRYRQYQLLITYDVSVDLARYAGLVFKYREMLYNMVCEEHGQVCPNLKPDSNGRYGFCWGWDCFPG